MASHIQGSVGLLVAAAKWMVPAGRRCDTSAKRYRINLVDPASSHMLVSKIKPCMSQYKLLHGKTANGSLKQL